MSNAQLDNEKQTFRYEVELLKDQFEDAQEALIETQRERKERCKVGLTVFVAAKREHK